MHPTADTPITAAPPGPARPHSRLGRRAVRRVAALTALLAAAVLASGCFRMEIAFEVNDDGTGTATFLSAMETEMMEMLGEGETPDGPLADIDESELPPGASVEAYNEDGFQGSRVTIPFEHDGDVVAALAALDGETPVGGADDPFENFELRRDGDRWIFNAAMNVGEEMGEDLGSSGEDEMMRSFFESASFTVRVKLPGQVTEHNADRVEGNTLIWDLDVLDPQTREMSATSDPSQSAGGDGGSNTMLIVGIVVAVVVIAAIAAFVLMRRKPAAGTPAGSA